MGRRQAPIGWHLPEFRPLARKAICTASAASISSFGAASNSAAKRKLSDYQRTEAIKRPDAGETLAAVAKSYGVSLAMISRLYRRLLRVLCGCEFGRKQRRLFDQSDMAIGIMRAQRLENNAPRDIPRLVLVRWWLIYVWLHHPVPAPFATVGAVERYVRSWMNSGSGWTAFNPHDPQQI
jgi:hypothetical protein